MLNPDKKREKAPRKKLREQKERLRVLDLTPRRDSKAGGAQKSSPVALPIPPEGFIAPDNPR
jgi:hypothetical protein